MISYTCKFFTPNGRVFGQEKIEAADDAAINLKAFHIHAHSIGGGYEIRDGERLVRRVEYPNQRPASL
jgi:hypothetical protein